MAIAAPTAGARILTSDLAAFYNLLKGVSGSGESVTLIYNAAGVVILQPSSDPAAATEALQIKNNAGTVQSALSFDGRTYLADGLVGTPALAFEGEKTTGAWRPAASTLAWSLGGTERVRVTASNLTLTGPGIIFSPDNTVDIGASGATRPRSGYFGTALVVGTNPAASGAVRVPNTVTGVVARNAANGADISLLGIDGANNIYFGGTSGTHPNAYVFGGTSQFAVLNNAGNANNIIATDGGSIQFPRVGTTVTAANAFIDPASNPKYNLLQSTSSLRYKNVLGDLSVEDARRIVMGLRPIVYKSNAEADDPKQEFVGLGAEHVAEVDDRFIVRDREGRPAGVQYQSLVAPLIEVVKDMERRLVQAGI